VKLFLRQRFMLCRGLTPLNCAAIKGDFKLVELIVKEVLIVKMSGRFDFFSGKSGFRI
jgi:hypothetical protein